MRGLRIGSPANSDPLQFQYAQLQQSLIRAFVLVRYLLFPSTATKENGEFCLAVPATRTAGMLTQLIKGAGR